MGKFCHIRSISRLILFSWVAIPETNADICVETVEGLLFRMNICIWFIMRVWRNRWMTTIINRFRDILREAIALGVHIFDDLYLFIAAELAAIFWVAIVKVFLKVIFIAALGFETTSCCFRLYVWAYHLLTLKYLAAKCQSLRSHQIGAISFGDVLGSLLIRVSFLDS